MSKTPNLVYYPSKCKIKNYKLLKDLLTKCETVIFPISDSISNLIKEMKRTIVNIEGFYHDNCLGLAANQIGEQFRIILMSKTPNSDYLKHKFFDIMINPTITSYSSESKIFWEGCVSDNE